MRVLVSGGAGFIGSNLVRQLLRDGAHVVVVDNLVVTGDLRLLEDAARHVEFVHADIADALALDRIPPGPFDCVYHLAASFANELSVERPDLDRRTNVLGTRNLLERLARRGCGLFVYAASSSSYGDVDPPFREDGPMRPYTPYATSKLEAEDLVIGSGLPFAIFRLFNVFGPRDIPGRYRNVIPNMICQAAKPDGHLTIFGTNATRDFTFVDDVVTVMRDAKRAESQVVNVGTGREIEIVDLARKILALLGRPADRLLFEPPRDWDRVQRRCADVSKLRALGGAVPSTTIGVGLNRAVAWMRAAGWIG